MHYENPISKEHKGQGIYQKEQLKYLGPNTNGYNIKDVATGVYI